MAYLINPLGQDEMRRLAQRRLMRNGAGTPGSNLPSETRVYLEDLTLRLMELELQNEHHEHSRLQLDQAVNRYRELYDFAPVPMLSLSVRGIINRVNIAAARCLGLERVRLLGQDFGTFLVTEDLSRFHSEMAAATAEDVQRFEIRLECDGMKPSHWLASLKANSDASAVSLVLVDVTEPRLRQDECKRAEDGWKQVIDAVGEGSWDWNVATGEFSHSARFGVLFGAQSPDTQLTLEQLRGSVHPDDWPLLLQQIQNHFQGQLPSVVQTYRVRSQAGAWCKVMTRGAVTQRAPDGRALRMMGTLAAIDAR
ncbi:MAG: hypothetical protein RJA34_2620 [Pseudomonadota bacterium]|jgi:PAS domain S-box-containing protein